MKKQREEKTTRRREEKKRKEKTTRRREGLQCDTRHEAASLNCFVFSFYSSNTFSFCITNTFERKTGNTPNIGERKKMIKNLNCTPSIYVRMSRPSMFKKLCLLVLDDISPHLYLYEAAPEEPPVDRPYLNHPSVSM